MAESSGKATGSGGSATRDLIWLVLIMAGLWLFWVISGGPAKSEQAPNAPFINLPDSGEPSWSEIRQGQADPSFDWTTEDSTGGDATFSLYDEQIRLLEANARTESASGREYVIIENISRSGEVINLSGWALVNGVSRRSRPVAAVIPLAARIFSPDQAGLTLQPVLLAPGGQAVIMTGSPPNRSGWPARTSFLENRCVGYLEEKFETLNFGPGFNQQCPEPSTEPGLERLDDECYDFVRRLTSCYQPEQLDNLSRACRLYLEDHFNYERCLYWHQGDENFYTQNWRIYLNQHSELWAENRESIRLYDHVGRLVDEIKY